MIVCVYAGQSGLGKSTLMNTLFKSKVSRKSVMGTAEERIPKTIEIKSISHGKAISCFCPETILTHYLHMTPVLDARHSVKEAV